MRNGSAANATVSDVAHGGVTAFIIYGLGVCLTYCSQLVVAHIVGVEAYGEYAYVFAWMVVLGYFAALGFDVGLLRFVPAYQTGRAWPLLAGVIIYAQRSAAFAGVVIGGLGIFAAALSTMPLGLKYTFLIGFALVPVLAILRIRCAAIRALGGVISAIAPDRIVREGTLIGLVAIASLVFGKTIDAPHVMVATLAGSAIGLLCAGLALQRRRPAAIAGVPPAFDAPTWLNAALPLVIIGATEVLLNRTGVIILGWLGHTKEAGIYSLTFNIAMVVTLPRVAVNTLFAPAMSGLHVRNDKAMMQVLMTRASSWTFSAAAIFAIVLYVLAEPLLNWFGSGFEAGVPALKILLVGQTITAGAGSQLYVMTMTGHERAGAKMLIAAALVNAALSVILIEKFGIAGAAIGTAATLIVWNAVMALFIWRRLKLLPGMMSTGWHFKPL